MTSSKALRERWTTLEGTEWVHAIVQANATGASRAVFVELLKGLPGAEDVESGLDFRGLELPRMSVFRELDLEGADFTRATLVGGFSGCSLERADLSKLSGTNLSMDHCRCRLARLEGARLPGVQLWFSDLSYADLSGAVLTGGRLKDSKLTGAVLCRGDLRRVWAANADLRGADLREVDATGGTFGAALFDAGTLVEGATFSQEGLDPSLAAHVQAAGGSLGASGMLAMKLAEVEGTLGVLERGRAPQRLRKLVAETREALEANPECSWLSLLRDRLTDAELARVERAAEAAIREL